MERRSPDYCRREYDWRGGVLSRRKGEGVPRGQECLASAGGHMTREEESFLSRPREVDTVGPRRSMCLTYAVKTRRSMCLNVARARRSLWSFYL